ncbi:MAG: thioredoxin family protein [Actinomycetia bacterium]|nr:thioredoxin family protein [Actinomycetes bacterium]
MDWAEGITAYKNLTLMGGVLAFASLVLLFTYLGVKNRVVFFLGAALLSLSVAEAAFSTATEPNWKGIYNQQVVENPSADPEMRLQATFYTITWEELTSLQQGDRGYFLVYVGRDSCPECSIFKPMLIEVAQEDNVPVLYYNTEKDRNNDGFDQKIETLRVGPVPTLKIVGNNQVIDVSCDARVFENKEALTDCLLTLVAEYSLTYDNFPLRIAPAPFTEE